MSNTDRSLKNIPYGDLQVMVNTLHEAIQSAKFCGLFETAERLTYMRQQIVDEQKSRAKQAIASG